MANNRLFIGDKKTKRYVMISKGWGFGWEGIRNIEDIKILLRSMIGESGTSEKTSLILFTEYDDVYNEIETWEDIKDAEVDIKELSYG